MQFVSVNVPSFHTTQYDLNFLQTLFRICGNLWFPYYIVRFKPPTSFIKINSIIRFHTTQYDLNPFYLFYSILRYFSFHTTQYDLNLNILFCDFKRFLFPYYIVRFKHAGSANGIRTTAKFPYYIVRFKLTSRKYDFPEYNMFPYYIVRFKQDPTQNKPH